MPRRARARGGVRDARLLGGEGGWAGRAIVVASRRLEGASGTLFANIFCIWLIRNFTDAVFESCVNIGDVWA